jgi:hypothetical protein
MATSSSIIRKRGNAGNANRQGRARPLWQMLVWLKADG